MIVAAGGGERDIPADTAIPGPGPARTAEKPEAFLNEQLDERSAADAVPGPALQIFWPATSQSSMALHGSSRTFMRRRGCRRRTPSASLLSRIEAGQSDIALVGGSTYNSERGPALMLLQSSGGFRPERTSFVPVWQRSRHIRVFALAAMGAFLVIEVAGTCRSARRQAQICQAQRRAIGSLPAQARRRDRGAEASVG